MKRMIVRGAIAAGLLSAVIVAALASATPRAAAQDHAWCAVYSTGSENCSFVSPGQCANSLGGIGGFCRMSAYQSLPMTPRRH